MSFKVEYEEICRSPNAYAQLEMLIKVIGIVFTYCVVAFDVGCGEWLFNAE